MWHLVASCWTNDSGQDVAEYALMLTLLLVLTAAIIKSIGTTAGSIFTLTSQKLSGQ